MSHSLKINLQQILNNLNINSGKFNISVNIFVDILGSLSNRLYISEISPSRKEIRINRIDDSILDQWNQFKEQSEVNSIIEYVINFGSNNTNLITNWVYDTSTDSIIIRLYKPLLDSIIEKDQLWISKIIANSINKEIQLTSDIFPGTPKRILQPNFNNLIDNQYNGSTEFKTWTDLVTNNTDIQRYILNYTSGSKKLNLDYTNFENFIHFGNAREKLANFYYKIKKIEQYNTQIENLNTLDTNQIQIQKNLTELYANTDEIIRNFDGYEHWLYFESSSYYEDSFGIHALTSWPKYPKNSNSFYPLYSVTSSQVVDWYTEQIILADDFDKSNPHSIIKLLPQYITEDDYNSELFLFVYLLGDFFDRYWLDIKNLNQIYKRFEELTISKQLLPSIAENFGIKLFDGNSLKNLWEYIYGFQQNGQYLQSGSLHSISSDKLTHEIWNRLLNNLPYLLKTKGTARGITALLNCYGVPSSILNIKEYGGPIISGSDIDSEYSFKSLNYALDFTGSEKVTSIWGPNSTSISSVQLRFKNKLPADQWTAPAARTKLFTIEETLIASCLYSGSTYGYIEISDGVDFFTSSKLKLYDEDFWNITLEIDSGEFTLYTQKSKYGELVYSDIISSSDLSTIEFETVNGEIILGCEDFIGSIQEFRQWSNLLSYKDITNHTKYIRAINCTVGSPYDTLITRYSFDKPENHSIDFSIQDIKPNLIFTNHGVASGFSEIATGYPYNYSAYLQDLTALVPNFGIKLSNKIRLEENFLSGPLDPHLHRDVRSYDYAPIDSNRLSITLSPTDIINKDIIAYYADANFDNFIGDPRDRWQNYYSGLTTANLDYWKQYANANNFWDYIHLVKQYNIALYHSIRQFVPARAKLSTGITIEPHILNRSKIEWKKPNYQNKKYTTDISLEEFEELNVFFKKYTTDISLEESKELNVSFKKYATVIDSIENLNIASYNRTFETTIQLKSYDYNSSAYSYVSGDNIITLNGTTYEIRSIADQYNTSSFTPIYNIYITGSNYSNYGNLNDVRGPITLGYSYNHYRWYRDTSHGYRNSRYIGCIQTNLTTFDGLPAVEILLTNIDKLIVNDDGKTGLRIN